MDRTIRRGWIEQVLLLALVAVAACGYSNNGYGSGPNPPPPPPPALMVAKGVPSGDGQSATVATPLTEPLRVLVTRAGVPEAGAQVTWMQSEVGGTITPAVGITDANGNATTQVTLGQRAGQQVIRASVANGGGVTNASSVTFSSMARADAPKTIALGPIGPVTGLVNTVFGQGLQAIVKDQFGNPVSGVTVTWRVASGQAMLTPALSITNLAGVAISALTFGDSAGPIEIQAISAGLTGSPVSIPATATLLPRLVTVQLLSSGGNRFSPNSVQVTPGTTIRFSWVSGFHNVTSTGTPDFPTTGDSFNSPHTLDVAFAAAGTYRYFCSEHGTPTAGMRGTIVVQ